MDNKNDLLKLLYKKIGGEITYLKEREEAVFWYSLFFFSAIAVIGLASNEFFNGIITKIVLSGGILLLGWAETYYLKEIALRKKEENEKVNNVINLISDEDKDFLRKISPVPDTDFWKDDFFLFVLKMVIVYVIVTIFLF